MRSHDEIVRNWNEWGKSIWPEWGMFGPESLVSDMSDVEAAALRLTFQVQNFTAYLRSLRFEDLSTEERAQLVALKTELEELVRAHP